MGSPVIELQDLPPLLTVREVAGLLRLHRETVRRLLRSGRLRGLRPVAAGSGHFLVPRAELRAFLEGRRPSR